MRTLSLVIPTYNEESNLPALFAAIETIRSTVAQWQIVIEAVIVDNRSLDTTWPELQEWAAKSTDLHVTLIQHPVNLGMQQSLLTGVRNASGDAIVVMQSDLQDPPTVVIEMVEAWNGGARYVATQIQRREGAWVPRLGAWGFYRLLAFVSDERIIPDSSDFYLFDSTMQQQVVRESGTTPFLRASLSAVGEPSIILKYERLDRDGGSSNYNLKRRVNFALDALLRNLGGLVKKTIAIAALVGGIAVIGILWLLIAYLFGYRSPVAGWISTTGILLVMLSTTMFIGSVTLELLARIYRDIPRSDLSEKSEIIRFGLPRG